MRHAPLAAALLSLAVAASPLSRALAGAWTQEQGRGQAVVTTTWTTSTRAFDDNGNAQPIDTFEKLETNLLLEYGWTDWLTLMLQPELISYDIAAPTDAHASGLGYTDIGARARLWYNPTSVFSVQVLTRIPGQHDDDNTAELGKTDAEFDIRALYGHSFTIDGMQAFTDAQLGYRVRFGDPTNEVRADFTFGIRPRERLLLLAQSFNTISDGSADGLFEDGREHKVQLSAVYRLDEAWAVQLGALATVAGEDALRQRGVVAALWRRF